MVDRVRKLLALAGSPNVHEAAAAAARAQALIAQHRLEGVLGGAGEADPVTDGADEPLERARKLRRWRVVLASALAEANGCVAYTSDGPDGQEIRLAGRSADRAAARLLWDWLLDRIQWLSATLGPGRPRAWHEAFRIGAVDAVAERLAQGDATLRASLPPASLARWEPAVAARRAEVERFVAERLRLGRGRALRVDARAFAAGRAAGASLRTPDPG